MIDPKHIVTYRKIPSDNKNREELQKHKTHKNILKFHIKLIEHNKWISDVLHTV